MLHAVLNPWTHWWGQPPWFQCCSREHLLWRIDHLNGLAGRRERGNFYPHFTGGRLKHKEEKEGQERCKWYVQGHPGRLVQRKLIHIFHSTPFPSSQHTRSLRQLWEQSLWSLLSCTVVTKRSLHFYRCRCSIYCSCTCPVEKGTALYSCSLDAEAVGSKDDDDVFMQRRAAEQTFNLWTAC